MLGTSQTWSVPEDAVFEKAAVLSHDLFVKPTAPDSLRLEGDGGKSEVVEYLHVDENDGKFYHEMRQDIEPCLRKVAELVSDGGTSAGKNKAGDFYLAAKVPLVVVQAWLNKRGLKMSDFKHDILDEFLNDSDNGAFRVWKGRV